MFGTSAKAGRGGGGGRGSAGKRNIHHNFQSSINRTSGGRLSTGNAAGHRNNRNNNNNNTPRGPTASVPSGAAEETFSLVTGNPLDFAMIIRLAPDLVDEIKRAESQGSSARIKFDANANHPSGNVIDVGGKDFRFTWSREMGDLCDIYEERRSGEDGNGLLVESGCAWRKLNVQRVLDESTKNHVKMRSEEAERKLKSRKAIVLDHGSPNRKPPKALAFTEVNQWNMSYKQKKEPPYKKRKAEPPPGPPKSVNKHGVSSTTPSKGRPSTSPLSSTPEQPIALASPFGPTSLSKGHVSVENIVRSHATTKEKATGSEKEMPKTLIGATVLDKPAGQAKLDTKPTDLKSLLISLLMENPKGMSLKALEKAIGETIPNSVRQQIEPILKRIAIFQTPGKYLLKEGVDLENLKKPQSENGSSPEANQHQTPTFDENCDQAPVPKLSVDVKTDGAEFNERVQLNSERGEALTAVEKLDIPLESSAHYAEKKVLDNTDGLVATSSDSGSESDSESDSSDSDSDSGSHSRSKSKSPVGSASSSDSESDASSNSKEGSDEDVDIMTSDDDKEPKDNVQAPQPVLSTSPILRKIDGEHAPNQDHDSELVNILETSPDEDQGAGIVAHTYSVPNKESEKPAEKIEPSSADHYVPKESQIYTGNLYGERQKTVKDAINREQFDSSQRKSEAKLKRHADGKNFNDNAERSKKAKTGNVSRAQISEERNFLYSESTEHMSPARPSEDTYRGLTNQITDRAAREETDSGQHMGYNPPIPGNSISDSQQSGLRPPVDLIGRSRVPSAMDKPGKYAENVRNSVKISEKSLQVPVQKDKVNREVQGEDDLNIEKAHSRNSKEAGVKHSTPVDSHHRKRGESATKFKEAGSASNSHMGYPLKDNNRSDIDIVPMMNGRGAILQRELSDLELGEFRDPLPEEIPGVKKQFERKGSFKQSENKNSDSDYWNFDASKGRPAGKTSIGPVKPSPPNTNIGILSNPQGFSKKRSPETFGEDSAKPQYRVVQTQPTHMPRVDQAEVLSQVSKVADVNSKNSHNEAITSQGIVLEGFEDTHRKVPSSAPQQYDSLRGVTNSTKESKREKTNILIDSGVRRKNPSLIESHDGGRKRRASFSEENSFLYSKYEKEEPDLKGPIKDYTEYMDYVEEYREKYHIYSSINKMLEAERNEFNKFKRDLETAKERDMNKYSSILGQLKESYRQCGMTHKRLKKVFVVLHEELTRLKEMIKDFADSYTKD